MEALQAKGRTMSDRLKKQMSGVKSITLDDCSFNDLADVEIADKTRVVEYLRANELVAMCAGWMTDRVTGKQVAGWRPNFRTDGVYAWGESLAYYVARYNLELPPEFLAHIYSRLDR